MQNADNVTVEAPPPPPQSVPQADWHMGSELFFGKTVIPGNIRYGLAALHVPLLFYVLASTGSLRVIGDVISDCAKLCGGCWGRITGRKTSGKADKLSPRMKQLLEETHAQIAAYSTAVSFCFMSGYYFWLISVEVEEEVPPVVWTQFEVLWLVMEVLLVVLLFGIKTHALSMRWISRGYTVLMLLISLMQSPGTRDLDLWGITNQGVVLLRFAIVPISDSTLAVFLCNLICHLNVLWTLNIFIQEAIWFKGNRARVSHLIITSNHWYLDTFCSLLCVIVHSWLQRAVSGRVTRLMENSGLRTQVQASESLLATFCDAHCFLDADLCFEKDERAVAAMVFRNGNNKGTRFTQYLATPEDEQRFVEVLARAGGEGGLAQAVHLGMRDAHYDLVAVELFHVETADWLGRNRHLIGLREYSPDSKNRVPDTFDVNLSLHDPGADLLRDKLPGRRGRKGIKQKSVASVMPAGEESASSDGSVSEAGTSVTDNSSLKTDPELTTGVDEAFALFILEMEIMGASKKLLDKTGIVVRDGSTFREFVGKKDESAFMVQLCSMITKAAEEGGYQSFEMKLGMEMGSRKRAKAKWNFSIHAQKEGLVAKAVLKSLKPVQKTYNPGGKKKLALEGVLSTSNPLAVVEEVEKGPLTIGRTPSHEMALAARAAQLQVPGPLSAKGTSSPKAPKIEAMLSNPDLEAKASPKTIGNVSPKVKSNMQL